MPNDTFYNLPEQKQNRIIQIAIEEFSKHDYDSASISNIVRKAGIAKGSFYQYFNSKKDCYHYLVEVASEEKLKFFQNLPAPDPYSDLFGYLRWQFLAAANFELRRPQFAQVLYRAFIEDIPFPDMSEELRRRGTTQFFKQLLSQGILHGKIAVWVDPDVAAFITEVVFYQFGKYLITRLGLTEEKYVDNTIFEQDEAQTLLNNLMDILEAGMRDNPDQRRKYLNQD